MLQKRHGLADYADFCGTDNENEVNDFLLETRVKQINFMLEDATIHKEKYNNGKQAYTYKFIEKEV